ncbi:polysaccharide biosynthesis/export family protein [Methylocystis sp.]|uniref:polysaccharide biosynthesis/export family protein n=1 Tax=Methylocystis sp. TaxID=1911079 RepID=UPI003DA4C6D9
MAKQNLESAAGVGRVIGVALWVACVGFLSGCNSYLGDEGNPPPEKRAGRDVSSGAGDRAELERAADKYLAPATPGNAAYRIGPQDVLDITVFKAPDLSKTVQVAEVGTINLPLVGNVAAAGKTAAEVEHDLEAKLGAKYLKSPQVTVFVKEYNSQRVTVEGAVKRPGVYPIRGHDTLMQSIAKAEGLDRESASSNVVVFRTTNGVRSAMRFDINDIRSGNSEDPPIQAGDVIVVDDSMAKSAFQSFVKVLPLAGTAAFVF